LKVAGRRNPGLAERVRCLILRALLDFVSRSCLDRACNFRPHLTVDIIVADDGVDVESGDVALENPEVAAVPCVQQLGGIVCPLFSFSPAPNAPAVHTGTTLSRPRLGKAAKLTAADDGSEYRPFAPWAFVGQLHATFWAIIRLERKYGVHPDPAREARPCEELTASQLDVLASSRADLDGHAITL
jgi:hypothetical protein